jgi:formylmethanofuran dehydrogenase subunit E
MGSLAEEILSLELPRRDKRLIVIAETDGCTVDGLIAATGCRIGSRTLRIFDFGKVAATFIDTCTGRSIRISPRCEARSIARVYTPKAKNKWEAMLIGYQVMPASELFDVQEIRLNDPISQIISQPGRKAVCEVCGEEIINGREVSSAGLVLCRACAGEGYYHFSASPRPGEKEPPAWSVARGMPPSARVISTDCT